MNRHSAYRSYLVALLALVLAFNQVDRLALGLLLQNIKADLSLSDTQLGVLSGIAFAMFYSVMGLPLGRWADRGNRVSIIALTTALWSAAVALSGAAGNFAQLLLIRVGAAVGEAGCIPTALSLIADSFDRAERPRAVSRYMLGMPLSGLIGYFFAGWLNELYGWRATFVLLGLPGLVLALLAWSTLKEPRRLSPTWDARRPRHSTRTEENVVEALRRLWFTKSFRHLLLCFCVCTLFSSGIGSWQAAFFIRSYGLRTGELGTYFAVINGLSALIGIYFGGELASRLAGNNESLQLRGIACVYCSLPVIWALIYVSRTPYASFGWMALATLLGTLAFGPLFAITQSLVSERLRAMSVAIIYLFANLIGMGIGPLLAGALSDAFRPWLGEESLRYALLVLCPGTIWGAWHAWRASIYATSDIELAQTRVSEAH